MNKKPRPENREEPFEIDWSRAGTEEARHDDEPPFEPATASVAGLPIEPAAPWETEDDYDADTALANLLEFHLYGRHEPHAVPGTDARRPVAALLAPYRDIASVRHDFPVVITRGGERPFRTLTDVIDEVVAGTADEGDVGERRARHIHQLEATIRRLCQESAGDTLSTLWERAARELLDEAASDDKRDLLEQSITAARGALSCDGETIPCGPDAAVRMIESALASEWEARCAAWRDDLDALIQRAHDALEADASHASDAASADHLRDASGTDDVDFDAMAQLLRDAHLSTPLAPARRERIQEALGVMERTRPLFRGKAIFGNETGPVDMTPVVNDLAAALERRAEVTRVMVDFFRAVHVAELELDNRYREDRHDRFFARYGATHLTDEENARCPLVPVVLTGEFFEPGEAARLLELVSGEADYKVLVVLDDVGAGGDVDAAPAWPTRLGTMAAALGTTYVLQAPIANVGLVEEAFRAGLAFRGPALFSVYANTAAAALPAYLATASASEARAFPALVYNPAAGASQAERMDVAHNSQSEKTWPEGELRFAQTGGEDQTRTLRFTPADFFYADVRFDRHFWCVPPSGWHQAMVPADEVDGSKDEPDHIPYITAIDPDGTVMRVVVTRAMMRLVDRMRASWRVLQEAGGIDSSFAQRAVESERGAIEEEKNREIEEIEKKYAADLERDLGALTEEIVGRIASRLISGDAGAALAVPSARPAPRPAAAPPAGETASAQAEAATEPQETAAEEDDDEIVVMDDPYIDTPLCTSCNDCMKVNALVFGYDANKQAYIMDASAATYHDLVVAAEKCPVKIIHPGKPKNPDEPGLDELIKRAEPFL